MKMHGLVIAGIPSLTDKKSVNILCSAIEVEETDERPETIREHFRLLPDHTFDDNISITRPEGIFACTVRLTNTIETLIELQKTQTATAGVKYRPVVLEIGEDGRFNLNIAALCIMLFGQSFRGLTEQRHEDFKYRLVRNFQLGKLDEIKKTLDESAADIKKGIALAKKVRAKYLHEHSELPHDYIEACAKLPSLLEQCTLKLGCFNKNNDTSPENQPVTALDKRLKKLKTPFMEGNKAAVTEVLMLARMEGQTLGISYSRTPSNFAYRSLIKGFETDQSIRNAFPSFEFMHWSITAREAFLAGFYETYRNRHNNHLKLPLDEACRPFTDPASDRVKDEIQVARGTRIAFNTLDNRYWRGKIIGRLEKTSHFIR